MGIPFLSGELVYKFRCAFLHSGSANIENREYHDFKLDKFIIRLEKKNKFDIYADEASINETSFESEYIVNIRRLCQIVLLSANAFIRNENDTIISKIESIKIQDSDKYEHSLRFASPYSNSRSYRIVSWNCNGKFREKFKKIMTLNADIYLIQECENPAVTQSIEYQEFALNHLWMGGNKSKGLGIFARKGIVLESLDWEALCLKYFMPVRVNDEFDILAIWTQNPYIEEYYIYQYVNRSHYNNRTILFGDLNSNKRFDKKFPTRKERGHTPTINELAKLGFGDAYHFLSGEEQGLETKNTFYLYRHLDRGFHIDHCFIHPELLKSHEVLDEEVWLDYSDHMPCVLEIEISMEKSKGGMY